MKIISSLVEGKLSLSPPLNEITLLYTLFTDRISKKRYYSIPSGVHFMPFSAQDLHSGIGIDLDTATSPLIPHFHLYECGNRKDIANWNYENMRTSFWSLWHFEHEGGWIEHRGEKLVLEQNHFVLSPPHGIISMRSDRPVSQLWLHFKIVPEYVFDVRAPFRIPLDALLQQQVRAIREAYGGDPVNLNHLAVALLHDCFARHTVSRRTLPEDLRKILQQIEDHLDADLPNPRMAALVGMSESGFVNWFREHMGKTPAAYVRDMRYQKSCRLLVFSKLSIDQIAAKLGYPSRHYFSRIFIKRTGCGPSAYRKRHG